MVVDIHITCCHNSTMKCRPRGREYPRSNVTEWTLPERLEISKISIQSLQYFIKPLLSKHTIRCTLLDDGSDIPEALEWMNSLEGIEVIHYPKMETSAVINEYMKTVTKPDLIVHLEDDQIYFNPLNLDWIEIAHRYLTSKPFFINKMIGLTFRNGLPSDESNPQFYHNWGAKGFLDSPNDNIKCVFYELISNNCHMMTWNHYKQFLPLHGNSGNCEALMSLAIRDNGLKFTEAQEFIHIFHTHKYKEQLPDYVTTEELNLSGMGIEYGIYNIHEHLLGKGKIDCSKFLYKDSKKRIIERAIFEGNYHYES